MQNLSSEQKKHLLEGGAVGVAISGETLEGAPVSITEDDIIEGTFSIDRNWVTGSTIESGCAETSELIFELDNSDGRWSDLRWEGTRLTVVLNIAGEPLQAGIFTVDEPPRKLTTMQIRALDDMARFNRPYASGISYPASLKQILLDACNQCNVTLYTLNFENDNYVVTERPVGDDITFHHVVAWVAELAGCNAWIDQLSRLQLSWYGESQSGENLEIGPDDRFSYELAETDIEITGIIYRTDETDYLAGNDKYALVIEDNPLLQENYETVLTSLLTKLGGFKYRPYKFETLGYPHLWPGDKITKLIDAENNELASIITNHLFKLNGNSQIEARGETETVRGYATGAPFTPSQKRVLQAVAKIEAARHTSAMEQAVLQLNELMINSLGFYETTMPQETGASIKYIHDQPELENSTYIWTITELGFAWTDQGWNNGDPVWNYGVTVDGSIVAKILSVVGIQAEWIQVIENVAKEYIDAAEDLVRTTQSYDEVHISPETGIRAVHPAIGEYTQLNSAGLKRFVPIPVYEEVPTGVPNIEGFESGEFPADWGRDNSNFVKVISTDKRSGTYCLNIDSLLIPSWANIVKQITKDCQMSFWYKSLVSCWFYLDGDKYDLENTNGTWTQFTKNIGKGFHSFQWIGGYAEVDYAIRIDDIVFEQNPVNYVIDDYTKQGYDYGFRTYVGSAATFGKFELSTGYSGTSATGSASNVMDVWIQLPDDFKEKNFNVILSFRSIDATTTNYACLFKIELDVLESDKPNARFKVRARAHSHVRWYTLYKVADLTMLMTDITRAWAGFNFMYTASY